MIKLYPFECTDKKKWEYENIFHLIHTNVDICNKSILALGAGNEPISYWLSITGYRRVVHTDIDEERLKIYRERYSIHNNATEVKYGDIITFSGIGNEMFDCIYHVSSIEHFTTNKIIECLKNTASHLKSGGTLIFTGDVLYLYPEEKEENNYLNIDKIKIIISTLKEFGITLKENFDISNPSVLLNYAKENLYKQEKMGFPLYARHNRNLFLPPILFVFKKD